MEHDVDDYTASAVFSQACWRGERMPLFTRALDYYTKIYVDDVNVVGVNNEICYAISLTDHLKFFHVEFPPPLLISTQWLGHGGRGSG